MTESDDTLLKNLLAEIEQLKLADLRKYFKQLYGFEVKGFRMETLRRRIAYRLQERRLGGLSKSDAEFLDRLADEDDLANLKTPDIPYQPGTKIVPGTKFTREWRDSKPHHGAVCDEELPVECGASLQDEAVCGASKRQRGAFGLGDFAAGLAAIEFGGFAEVGQKVARHVLAAPAGGVVLVRGDGEEISCVHRCSLIGSCPRVSFARHRCIKEKQGRRKKES